ncbi:STAS domain-containing protein, partial [Roseibium sp.]
MHSVLSRAQLRTGASGFEEIARWFALLEGFENQNLALDFSQVQWIDANLASAVICVIEKLQSKDNSVVFSGASPRIQDILKRNGLFFSESISAGGTVVPLKNFSKDDGVKYSNYMRQYLAKFNLPKMTEPLRAKIYEGLDEVFVNSSIHSHIETLVYACGQFYPRLERLDFSVADGGIGMHGAYKKAFGKDITAEDAIEWALKDTNTTRVGDIPGGLGLKILRGFVKLNGGKFVVVSGDGYWMEKEENVIKKTLPWSYPGT